MENIELDLDTVLVSLWNAYLEEGYGNKICVNDADFMNNKFETPYDAAWAVSLSNRWKKEDDFVYFDEEGYITSFNHWDDERSPINLDKLTYDSFINSLKHKKKDVVNNIHRAIHDALENV